jgi:hypothetical protein
LLASCWPANLALAFRNVHRLSCMFAETSIVPLHGASSTARQEKTGMFVLKENSCNCLVPLADIKSTF